MLWVEMFSCELEVRLKGMDGSALNPALLAAFSLHSKDCDRCDYKAAAVKI